MRAMSNVYFHNTFKNILLRTNKFDSYKTVQFTKIARQLSLNLNLHIIFKTYLVLQRPSILSPSLATKLLNGLNLTNRPAFIPAKINEFPSSC